MRISIASDHGGFEAKVALIDFLKDKYELTDYGCYNLDSVDYPDFAFKVCESIISGRADFGIVICSTGIGISIAANKVKGIRCALVTSEFQAEMTRRHNNANCLALGAKNNSKEDLCRFALTFLKADFDGGRHELRVNKIKEYEEKL